MFRQFSILRSSRAACVCVQKMGNWESVPSLSLSPNDRRKGFSDGVPGYVQPIPNPLHSPNYYATPTRYPIGQTDNNGNRDAEKYGRSKLIRVLTQCDLCACRNRLRFFRAKEKLMTKYIFIKFFSSIELPTIIESNYLLFLRFLKYVLEDLNPMVNIFRVMVSLKFDLINEQSFVEVYDTRNINANCRLKSSRFAITRIRARDEDAILVALNYPSSSLYRIVTTILWL